MRQIISHLHHRLPEIAETFLDNLFDLLFALFFSKGKGQTFICDPPLAPGELKSDRDHKPGHGLDRAERHPFENPGKKNKPAAGQRPLKLPKIFWRTHTSKLRF